MPTRPFQDIADEARANWSPEAHDLGERLATEFEAELDSRELLGRQMTAARQAAKLTQPQLAEITGVQQADISRIERGLGNPTRDTLLRLAGALGLEMVLQSKKQ